MASILENNTIDVILPKIERFLGLNRVRLTKSSTKGGQGFSKLLQ